MMRPYLLTETNWDAVRNAEFELVVLPWGATEAHNYHLPYSSDSIEADFISAESARIAWEKGAKVMVLPTVPYGVNTGQTDIRFDMNINPSTQFAILNDIAEVLNRQKLYKLMILNSHGGNDFKPLIRELGLKFPDMFLCSANWFETMNRKQYFSNPGDHADEMETSLMLYLYPELVLPAEKWGEGKEKQIKIRAFSEGWLWTERKWSKITADTGVGNPEMASREKGETFFIALTQKLGEVMFDICKVDMKNLYT